MSVAHRISQSNLVGDACFASSSSCVSTLDYHFFDTKDCKLGPMSTRSSNHHRLSAFFYGFESLFNFQMHPLRGTVQPYAWGMVGSSSLVAQLASKSSSVVATQPYAEYWMGTHPKGESHLLDQKETSLKSYLGGDLPFLFKVLSVETALSIQAHPNKEHARVLHKANPKEYPDDNHKPEMAIALTEFECLCAFRPYKEIDAFLKQYEHLRILCGKEVC